MPHEVDTPYTLTDSGDQALESLKMRVISSDSPREGDNRMFRFLLWMKEVSGSLQEWRYSGVQDGMDGMWHLAARRGYITPAIIIEASGTVPIGQMDEDTFNREQWIRKISGPQAVEVDRESRARGSTPMDDIAAELEEHQRKWNERKKD